MPEPKEPTSASFIRHSERQTGMKSHMTVLPVFAALFILIAQAVSAATITGTVYGFDLTPQEGVVIAIDTTPHQQLVARGTEYSLNVPAGSYTLVATQRVNGTLTAQTSEKITVSQDGTYTLDLILFPAFEEDTLGDELVDPEEEIATLDEGQPWFVYAGIALLIAAGATWFVLSRKRKSDVPTTTHSKEEKVSDPTTGASKEDLDQLLGIIKRLGGRTTQKELRKEMPYSEAKVSLMLTELEHAGKLQKIKRGRANIVILR